MYRLAEEKKQQDNLMNFKNSPMRVITVFHVCQFANYPTIHQAQAMNGIRYII